MTQVPGVTRGSPQLGDEDGHIFADVFADFSMFVFSMVFNDMFAT